MLILAYMIMNACINTMSLSMRTNVYIMSNYPDGADDDPRAPWNQDPDEDDMDDCYYDEDEYKDYYQG